MTHDTPGVIAAVDDDQTVLKSLQTLLESADYAVRIFASGPALLESGWIAKIDCLISDIGMPGMDGFELSRIARAARPGLPVILITGRAELLKVSRAISRGEHSVFEKPFDGEKLLAAIAGAVRTQRVAKPQS